MCRCLNAACLKKHRASSRARPLSIHRQHACSTDGVRGCAWYHQPEQHLRHPVKRVSLASIRREGVPINSRRRSLPRPPGPSQNRGPYQPPLASEQNALPVFRDHPYGECTNLTRAWNFLICAPNVHCEISQKYDFLENRRV